MRVEELFALALRIIGAVLLYYGLHNLLDAGLFRLGYFNYPDSSPNYYLISGLFLTLLGVYLLRGARGIVKFAYPPSGDDKENDQSNEDEAESH